MTETSRVVAATPAATIGALIVMAGALLAFAVHSWLWGAVLAVALLAGLGSAIALVRATRLAMRPPQVKHSHGWWTSVLRDPSRARKQTGTNR